jgi:hypothetical protein
MHTHEREIEGMARHERERSRGIGEKIISILTFGKDDKE